MKKILWVLLLALCVVSVQAAPSVVTTGSRRQVMLEKYAQKNLTEQEFLREVKAGNSDLLARVKNLSSLVTAQDSFGNNCLHLAPTPEVLNVLAAAARRADDTYVTFFRLLNQRNHIGETPLLYQLRAGHAFAYEKLFRGSALEAAIVRVNAVSGGGALVTPAEVQKGVARLEGSDKAGWMIGDIVQQNIDKPGMYEVAKQLPGYLYKDQAFAASLN